MRILIVHNQYQQSGGEDSVVESEYALLKEFNEEVRIYKRSNAEILSYNFFQKLKFFFDVTWSRRSYQEMKTLLREFQPDIVHFHNIFFLLTPSVYTACKEQGVAVVQSLHNFRLRCANGLLFRDNQICEKCLKGSVWQAVFYRCYRNSRLISALVASLLDRAWRKGVWRESVDRYIMATDFGRQKMIEAGIPADKISVKPNFLRMDNFQPPKPRGYALFVGRLSPEKGIRLLLETWKDLLEIPLKIMGAGPLEAELKNFVQTNDMKHVEFLGFLPEARYSEYMRGARFIVVPSLCYENFPRIIAEGYAFGIPILASSVGTMKDLVQDSQTGLLFDPSNREDLKEKSRWLSAHDQEWKLMSQKARSTFEEKYSSQKNYEFLSSIYRKVIAMRNEKRGPAS